MNVLVVADHVRGTVTAPTLELVSAGATLGAVTVAVVGRDPSALAAQVAVAGVTEIVTVKVDAEEFDADLVYGAVCSLVEARRPDAVLVAHTVNGMAVGPRLAASLSRGFASDVYGLAAEGGGLTARRSFYGGKVEADIELDVGAVVTVRPTSYPAAVAAAAPPVAAHAVDGLRSRCRHRRLVEPEAAADVDITQASFLLAIGRGVEDADNIPEFQELADQMGATLASSRPLVDAGWMPSSRQVGQSGKTVTPDFYLALGISGAIQHLSGMKGSGTVIAVNLDPEAPIFAAADYAAVADMFDVAAELRRLW